MSQQTIPTSAAPEISIDQIGGDLTVKGWERSEVMARSSSSDMIKLVDIDDVLHLSCDTNCEVRLPSGASIHLGTAHGNARFRLLDDPLKAETVHGSLYLHNVSEVDADTIYGDLIARKVAGGLRTSTVHGNVIARSIHGSCELDQVMGNLDLRDIDGNLIVAQCQGNARLRLSMIGGNNYELKAEGNVHCRIPSGADIKLLLSSDGEAISVKLPGQSKRYQQQEVELTLGNGSATLSITAGGNIHLGTSEEGGEEEASADFEEFERFSEEFSEQFSRQMEAQIEAQIEAQMEAMTRQLNEQLASFSTKFGKPGLSPEETERIMEKARARSERAAAQAQDKVRRAQERVTREQERMERRFEERARSESQRARESHGGFNFRWNMPPRPPVTPTPPAAPVSEEERLSILRMLEQKKISIDEAEMLLSALEGK